MVRCPRDACVAAVSAMIHLLSGAAWIMAVLPGHVSMVPTPYKIRDAQRIPNLERESVMAARPSSPDQQADIEQLTREIHQAVDTEIGELAANLVTTDDAHLFGDNEFQIRALAHKIAAKAVERHLARKKTATRGPA
jgi:hypothetical protein